MLLDPSRLDCRITARRCVVSGRVQGVCFRASTRNEAIALGLTGYARNLADGRVEVLVEGQEEAVQTLIAWLAHGPPAARVDAVEIAAVEFTLPHAGFAVF